MRAGLFGALAALLLPLCAAATEGPQAAAPDELATVERLLSAVNAMRAEHGLPQLHLDPTLQGLSQDYARLMAEADCLSHDCAGRGAVGQRARAQGYDYLLIGEALAGGPPDAETVVQLWMTSEPHRAVLLHGEVRDVGGGYVYRSEDGGAAPYGHYWVLTVGLTP